MRVQCPDCRVAYDVPEHLLVGRKSLRCARCGAEWKPGGAAPEPTAAMPRVQPMAEVAAATPAPARRPATEPAPLPPTRPVREQPLEREPFSAMQRLALPVEPPRRSPWTSLAWLGSLLVLAALAWGAVNWRADVMHAWPPSTRAYAALGLAPSAR